MPTYSIDWFGNNGSTWIKFLAYLVGKPDLRFLEIGCFEGRATIWLLDHILTHETSRIETIDTFRGSMEHETKGKDFFVEAKKHYYNNIASYKKRVITHEGLSGELLRSLPLYSYDFIYVDGSHTSPNVLEDTILAWRLLKNHSILIWDDYTWDKFKSPLLTPRLAIDTFLYIYKGQYQVLHQERQVIIYKTI